LIVALMAGIAITMILTTVAVQAWSDVLRRDNEAEMIFRAQDIVRALKRFQMEKGKLPTELKELMEPGNKGQYFLRRLWKDPLVKGGQWQYLYASPAGGLFDPTAAVPGALVPPAGLRNRRRADRTPGRTGAFPLIENRATAHPARAPDRGRRRVVRPRSGATRTPTKSDVSRSSI
jgi:type II secretory pathway pseudopilin PulG